jgi:hypothetical protein
LDNFNVIAGVNTDHALEIDGPEGTYNAAHNVKNGSVKGWPTSEMGDFRSAARGTFENLYFFNFPAPADNSNAGRGDLSLDANTVPNFTADPKILVFKNLEATLKSDVTLPIAFRNGTDAFAAVVALNANTVGATKAAFVGWTWADKAGKLVDFK